MNLEEYKKWLEQYANNEEQRAYEVVEEILKYHEPERYEEMNISVYPRHILTHGNNKIEFDLLICMEWIKHSGRRFKRLIGVEFKETDMRKVIRQAIIRRTFVDYMYIATWSQYLGYDDIFMLAYFGIGWVVWKTGKPPIMVLPAKYNDETDAEWLLRSLIEKEMKKAFEEIVRTKSLFEFGGDS